MKMRFYLTLSFLLVATISAFSQQDPLYNLYLFNQAMINPAYNGTYNLTSVTAITRAQWTGIEGAPVTNMINASTSFRNERLGAGMLVVNDKLGVNSNFEAQAAFSYKLKFTHSQLAFGLQGGVVNYKYNYDALHLETTDPVLTQNHMPNFTKPTIGAGVFFRDEKYYVGLSMTRMLNVDVADGVVTSTRYKQHIYLSGGYVISKFESVKIKPSALIRMVAGGPTTVDANVSVLFLETLWAGVSVRNFQAFGLNAQFTIKNKFRFGYAYELPTNSLYGTAKGTHELMVSLDLELGDGQFALRRYF